MIWLAEWEQIIVLHVRHAFWCKFFTQSAKRRREIFIFVVLTTTRARSSKFFILCLNMKTIRAKQAKVHFAYFVQRDQHGIISKHLNLTQSSILLWSFRCSSCRSFLNFLFTLLREFTPRWRWLQLGSHKFAYLISKNELHARTYFFRCNEFLRRPL